MKQLKNPMSGCSQLIILAAGMIGLLSVMSMVGCGSGADDESETNILGNQPAYAERPLSPVANEQAIGKMIWSPGLDEGFIPQGITFAEGQILISAYQSIDPGVDNGPSRVFSLDQESGEVAGWFDLPSDVGHPGALAYGGNGILYVGDRMGPEGRTLGKIYRIDTEKAFESNNCDEAVTGKILLSNVMGPSFMTYDGEYLWFGRWVTEGSGGARIYKINPDEFFEERSSASRVSPEKAMLSFEIDERTQGATFDKDGNLWLSQSSSKWGKLQKLDPANGDILDEYELMAGVEGMALSSDGDIWSVSEAGAIKNYNWNTYYPVIFQIDVAALQE